MFEIDHRARGNMRNPAVALFVIALALTGLFLFVADLAERLHWQRLLLELSLVAPLLCYPMARRLPFRR